MKKNVSLFFVLLFFSFCSKQEPAIFNGKISIVEESSKIDSLLGEKIELDDIYTGYMSVYDSLMLFVSPQYPGYLLSVFSLNSKAKLGSFCRKGNGPDDFQLLSHVEQFIVEKNEIKLWVYDRERAISLINLTRSIELNRTNIDTIIKQNWRQKYTNVWSMAFMLGADSILIKNQQEYLENDKYALGAYHLYERIIDNEINTYHLYNHGFPEGDQKIFLSDILLLSKDRLKPDKSKIAMGMQYLSQINILDLNTGTLKGVRLKNTMDFEDLTVESKFRMYNWDICVSDDYIFCLYVNQLVKDSHYLFESDEIHVFDWDGNFIQKLKLKNKINQIALDPGNNFLYGYSLDENIYQYNLNISKRN